MKLLQHTHVYSIYKTPPLHFSMYLVILLSKGCTALCSLIGGALCVSLGHKQTVEGRREPDWAGFSSSLVHYDSFLCDRGIIPQHTAADNDTALRRHLLCRVRD